MTELEFRTLALSLPEAIELAHYHDAAFRVGKKMFATLSPDGALAILKVPQRERLVALLEEFPEAFVETRYTAKFNAIGVELRAVDPLLLRDLLTDSWADVAPKRAKAALAQRLAERE